MANPLKFQIMNIYRHLRLLVYNKATVAGWSRDLCQGLRVTHAVGYKRKVSRLNRCSQISEWTLTANWLKDPSLTIKNSSNLYYKNLKPMQVPKLIYSLVSLWVQTNRSANFCRLTNSSVSNTSLTPILMMTFQRSRP